MSAGEREQGQGGWAPEPIPPKFVCLLFQISPILLTKGRFHHRTQRLAPRFNTTPPMVTLPSRFNGIRALQPLFCWNGSLLFCFDGIRAVRPLPCRKHRSSPPPLSFRRASGKGIRPLLRQTVDPPLVPSTQTHPFWMCFGVRRLSTCAPRWFRGYSKHEKHSEMAMFFMSGISSCLFITSPTWHEKRSQIGRVFRVWVTSITRKLGRNGQIPPPLFAQLTSQWSSTNCILFLIYYIISNKTWVDLR